MLYQLVLGLDKSSYVNSQSKLSIGFAPNIQNGEEIVQQAHVDMEMEHLVHEMQLPIEIK
jgi:hypothetical protein